MSTKHECFCSDNVAFAGCDPIPAFGLSFSRERTYWTPPSDPKEQALFGPPRTTYPPESLSLFAEASALCRALRPQS